MNRLLPILFLAQFLLGCGAPTIHNPSTTLMETGRSSRVHIRAMELLDAEVGIEDQDYQKQLHRIIWAPGFSSEAREQALLRLWSFDKEKTIRTLRQRLPRMNSGSWKTQLCEWIAAEQIVELHEALISAWANPESLVKTEEERPEYIALRTMYSDDAIADLIFDSMISAKKTWRQGYRTRCWELLHRLNHRARLISLLEQTKFDEDDIFFIDLQKAMNDLGIVPHRREEILWIRELSKPEHKSFWDEAKISLSKLDDARRDAIEMRNVPVVVSLQRHGGENAFSRTREEILNQLETKLKNATHHYETEGGGLFKASSELFHTHKNKLTWGDAITLEILLTALSVPEVKAHLFNYAKRDNLDETTEYGGVIALDKKGRFEILEFEPKIRHHDRRFNASQNMFDAAYTALFHFHFHAQKFRNGNHAGPGFGDKDYADNTRANCLVFTFVNASTLNVDYYRHGKVVVDVGTISIE